MNTNKLWLGDFFDLIEKKEDSEIKVLIEDCSKEELIDNCILLINELKKQIQYWKSKDELIAEISNLAQDILKQDVIIKDWKIYTI